VVPMPVTMLPTPQRNDYGYAHPAEAERTGHRVVEVIWEIVGRKSGIRPGAIGDR
jgi:hypothetical protein